GVVHDVRQYALDTAAADTVYVPFEQRGLLAATILVRAAGDPDELRPAVADAVRAVDPRQPLSNQRALVEVKRRPGAAQRVTMQLASLFAGLALVVTAAGIGGIVAFGVSQRTTEIGIRMALGAPRAAVIRLVAAQGLRPIVAGLLAGAVASWTIARVVAPAA